MISEEEYTKAVADKEAADEVINQYHAEQQENFEKRWKEYLNGKPFTDDDLIYAAVNLCPCGHGLAYPSKCSPFHQWDCAGVLKGEADPNIPHTTGLSFTVYNVKSENQPSAEGKTTRGVFKPKVGPVG